MLQSGFQFSDPSAPLFMVYGEEIPIFLAIGAVLAAVEVFLACKDDWRLGLIPAGAFFVWAAVKCVVRVVRWGPEIGDLFFALRMENIPTAVFLAAYAVCWIWRWRRSARQADRSRSLDKTRIRDL